jgi:predicted MFS family arabinose efflux permease
MATINLFKGAFFALYVLYATRSLQLSPAELGVILGPSSIGAIVGAAVAGRVSRRVGLGRAFLIGTILYTAPLVLVPLVSGPHLGVLAFLLLAECFSGMGLMVLEISNGSITAAAIPDHLRARVGGAMGIVNTGIRPVGALLGGIVPIVIGVHATLWVATLGACLGCLWLLPSPIIRLRSVDDFLPRE